MAHAAKLIPVEDGFEVSCSECGAVGSADDEKTAELIRRLHDRAFALAASVEVVAS